MWKRVPVLLHIKEIFDTHPNKISKFSLTVNNYSKISLIFFLEIIMTSYERFQMLCAEKGVTPYQVSKATGVSTTTFSSWKLGRYTPKREKVQAIAEYFGVSVDWLVTGVDDATPYYFDDKSREYARFLHDNPEYSVLFDAVRKVKPEDFEFVKTFLNKMDVQ